MIAKKINETRLWETLMELGEIGAKKDYGVTRLSLTKEDLEARDYLIQLMKKAGLEVRIDPIGNIVGRLEGSLKEAPVVLTGSHIDTVTQGGRFDGALGVLGAIEAVRTIKETGLSLTNPIEVVSFLDEEGTRFGTGYIGSKALVGQLSGTTFELKDEIGTTLYEAFLQAKLNPDLYKLATRKKEEVKAFIEMHIEQGKVLEEHQLPVGIVTNIQGPVWLEVTLKGNADHAGATPMYLRHDASLAMAEVLLEVEAIATALEGVGTVGKMMIEPGGVNIIPGVATFSIDLRHENKTIRTKMVDQVFDAIDRICHERQIVATIEVKKQVDPASCSSEIIQLLEETCFELQIPTMKLPCGAGHDALILASFTIMGMIFVRSKYGISHNPNEWSEKEDCALGTQLLFNTLVKLAK